MRQKDQTQTKGKKRHPGVHAKTKVSKNKLSKHYVKPYRGQGK